MRHKKFKELPLRHLLIPNQSRHTFGINEKTLPCASPSVALTTHRYLILSTREAKSWERKNRDETRRREVERGRACVCLSVSVVRPAQK